ncbi:MAG: hypothetical protein LBO73_00145, partial [Holosporaceae bacterium]|nr:hypothetical protein [Holosporaceae bacterium]
YRAYGESLTRSPFSKSKADDFCKVIEIVRSQPDSVLSERHKDIICKNTLVGIFSSYIYNETSFDTFCYTIRRVYGLYADGLLSRDCIKDALAKIWRTVCSVLWK